MESTIQHQKTICCSHTSTKGRQLERCKYNRITVFITYVLESKTQNAKSTNNKVAPKEGKTIYNRTSTVDQVPDTEWDMMIIWLALSSHLCILFFTHSIALPNDCMRAKVGTSLGLWKAQYQEANPPAKVTSPRARTKFVSQNSPSKW